LAVQYLAGLSGSTDVTHGVVAGTYTLRNLPPGATKYLRVRITPRSTAPIGSALARLVTTVSTHASGARDAVRAVVKVQS
jgi:hypothetical protein